MTHKFLRQVLRRQTEALGFLNDFALLLYGMKTDGEALISRLKGAGRQQVIDECLCRYAELREQDYEFGRALTAMDEDEGHNLTEYLVRWHSCENIEESAAKILDDLLQTMYTNGIMGNFITPLSLADMMARMLEPMAGEVVMDPVCGCGRLLVAAAKRCRDCRYIGMDLDKEIKTTAFFNTSFNGMTDVTLYQGDFLKNPGKEKVDVILANPPYSDDIRETLNFIDRMIYTLKEEGRCGILVPEGFLTNTINGDVVRMRRNILVNHSLECVISLPRKIYKPYTVSKSSLVLLSNQPSLPGHQVFFGDIPEYVGPENEFSDTVYEQSIKQITEAWKRWKKGEKDDFWTASLEEIKEKEYIFGANHYQRSKYRYVSQQGRELWERILKGQEKLNDSVYRYFREDSEI